MRKRYWIGITAILIAIAGYAYVQHRLSAKLMSDADKEQLKADVADQNETAFTSITPPKVRYQEATALRNVFFGDLHGHSDLSFDSYIFANRLSFDQSYRFAKGEALTNQGGEIMQLAVLLDFAAMTDHAEGFGLHEQCGDSERTDASVWTIRISVSFWNCARRERNDHRFRQAPPWLQIKTRSRALRS